jgi:peptide-methionine (R)-S-oxide reductase
MLFAITPRSPGAMKTLTACLTVLLALFLPGRGTGQAPDEKAKDKAETDVPKRVVKSDAEWRRLLSRDQYLVTRQKATEPAFSGKLVSNHLKGTYACICCGAPLFSSRTKFNSGTGWPSFYQALRPDRIATAPDYSTDEPRVEVTCATCDAHLGHVFSDGPPPTGLRYCINSLSLKFVKDGPTAATSKTKAATSKTKAKAAPKTKAKAPVQDEAGAKTD